MAVARMASIALVLDADELMRAIGRAQNKPDANPRGSGVSESSTTQTPAPARRMKVAGEVKADAPRKDPAEPEPAAQTPDLPDLRDFIRERRAPLAGFMEQGASLSLEADVLTVIPRKDIYVRYLNDNKSTIAALASELYDRKISVNFKSQQQGVTNSGPSFPERRDRSEAFSASDLPNNSRVVSAAG